MYFTLTQKELSKLLKYDKQTGLFTWLVDRRNRHVKKGSIAGCKHKYGYTNITIKGKTYLAHRLAFLYVDGVIPNEIDHINHQRDDNKWDNLRAVTRSENCRNSTKNKNNKSGINGVRLYLHSKTPKWVASIYFDGKNRHLGYFDTVEDATSTRLKAEELYGFHKNHGK